MEESLRQKQLAALLQTEMCDIFTKQGRNVFGNVLVTITKVYVTPDLLIARFFVSAFTETDKQKVMKALKTNAFSLKKPLVDKIRNKVRQIPTIEWFLDDSLDHVEAIDKLFKKLEQGDNTPLL